MEISVDDSNTDFMASLGLTLAYLVLLMVCGVVGNTLVFLVYYKRFKPSITRTYILAMSVCDLLTNCLALPSDIYEIRFHYDFDDDPGCKFFGYITRFLALSGAFILIAIALDRWRKICRSAKTERSLTQVYIELACLEVFALCYAIPFGVLRGLQTIPVPNSGVNGSTCAIEDKYVGSLLYTVYNGSTGLTFVICVSIMSVCYVLIARHLWQHKKRLLQYAKSKHHQGPDQDWNRAQQQARRRAEGGQATGPCGDQPALKTCTPGFNITQSEDEEDSAGPGVLQMSITEDSDLSGVVSDSDNTTTSNNPQSVMSTSLSNISETDTSTQPEPASGDVSTEHVISADTSGIVVTEKGNPKLTPKNLREAAMLASACQSHRDTTKARGEKPQKKKKKTGAKKIPSRTTLMMFILAAMYVVSYLPYLSMAALFRGKDMVGANFWEWNLHQIALRSFFINSAVNPLVYSFCSVRFRSECRLLLCRRH